MSTSCPSCKRLDTEFMVTCVKCNRTFHELFECCKDQLVNSGAKNWKCQDCSKAPPKDRTNQLVLPSTSTSSDPPDDDQASAINIGALGLANDHVEKLTKENDYLREQCFLAHQKFEAQSRAMEELSAKLDKMVVDRKAAKLFPPRGSFIFSDSEDEEEAERQRRIFQQNLLMSPIKSPNQSNPPSPIKPDASLPKLNIPNAEDLQSSQAIEYIKRLAATLPEIIDNLQAKPAVTKLERPSTAPVTSSSDSFSQLVAAMNRQYIAELPKFSGDIKEWTHFKATYNSTTIEGQFTEQQNIARLRKALEGQARKLVDNQLLFPTTATAIMKTLKQAYGDKRAVIAKLSSELLKGFSSITSDIDMEFVNFSIAIDTYCATIKSLGNSSGDLSSELLLTGLAEKLPDSNRRRWEVMRKKNPRLTVIDFATFVRERVQSLPIDCYHKKPSASSSKAPVDVKKNRVNVHVAEASTSKTFYSSESRSPCPKCSGPHALVKCKPFRDLSANEKFDFACAKSLCFSCLSKHSRKEDCKYRRQCNIDGCKSFHNRFLHGAVTRRDRSGQQLQVKQPSAVPAIEASKVHPTAPPVTPESSSSSKQNAILAHNGENSVLFKILPVRLYGKNSKFVDTFALLDGGSGLTLMDEELATKLELDGDREPLVMQWTKGITRKENSLRTSLVIGDPSKREAFALSNVYTVECLGLPSQTIDASRMQCKYKYLRSLPIPEYQDAQPKILIGLKHSEFLVERNTHEGGEDDPIAAKTRLGWMVYGKMSSAPSLVSAIDARETNFSTLIQHAASSDESLHDLVNSYFTTENFGVAATSKLVSEKETRAVAIFEKTLKNIGQRYEVGLLWKDESIKLPDTLPMAQKRLWSLERQLLKDVKLKDFMNAHIQGLVDKGYARVATKKDLNTDWPRVCYNPMFIVFNRNKIPPKPRVVTDVAAVVQGQSLNSNLLTGPDNLAPLLAGLFKLRERKVAVNGDIQEMFMQFRIIEQDQQCQRFLYRDCDQSKDPIVYVMQSMMFGPTCSPSTAQFVKNFHAEKFKEKYPEAVKALIEAMYVDDYFNSHDTVDDAVKITFEVIEILRTMGCNIIGFQSNDQDFLSKLPRERVKQELVAIDSKEGEGFITKVLGLFWNPVQDCFTFKLTQREEIDAMLQKEVAPTKREVLQMLMRIWDPLGIIGNFLIRGRIVLQEVWRDGIGWDEPLSELLCKSWFEFINQLQNIENIKVARRYSSLSPADSKITLLVFADASVQAFAAVAYLHFENAEGIQVSFVMAKAKVAPVKRLTIPQLELQAAVLAVRLAGTIKKLHQIDIAQVKFFSDSRTVLSWICSTKYDFKIFVAARIGEILEASTRAQWFYVPTKENVADDGTKWTDPTMGDSNSRWLRGPDFVREPECNWPVKSALSLASSEEVSAQTNRVLSITHAKAVNRLPVIDEIGPNFRKGWSSLTRTVAYLCRWSLRNRAHWKTSVLSREEIECAELKIFQHIQADTFGKEIKALTTSQEDFTHFDFDSKIRSLCPFLREGVIRMRSRSQYANVSYAARNPVILPNGHPLVDLFIHECHKKNFHAGKEMTIAMTRDKVWIIDTRKAVNRVFKNCQFCKIARAKPSQPLMGNLPLSRLNFQEKPFTHVGIDAFGPYNVKYGRGTIKRWGLIITCLTFRAVHLECLNDMSTEACIMALRRFHSRRGSSLTYSSDNGSNFIGSRNALHRDMNELKSALGPEASKLFEIDWHFIPAYSPWWGGAWERLIQSVKRTMDFVMSTETPREDIFANSLIEAELWMNQRPLTHVSLDHEDAPPLTPNTALFGDKHEMKTFAPGVFTERDVCSSRASRRVQHLVDKYLSRWNREYLPEINRRTKWFDSTTPVKVGDIVIMTDPAILRNPTRKGRITKIHKNSDEVIRTADVTFPDGSSKTNISVARLAVLDIAV